jgi:hypothetical protein
MLAGALGNVSTAFLSHQTSAFVVGARADQPDQAGGGVWMREVGGHVATKSDTTINTTQAPANEFGDKASTSSTCASRIEQNFLGIQVGTDVARLNSNGWNVHVGLTAGYLELQGRDVAQSFPPPIVAGGISDIPSVGSQRGWNRRLATSSSGCEVAGKRCQTEAWVAGRRLRHAYGGNPRRLARVGKERRHIAGGAPATVFSLPSRQ